MTGRARCVKPMNESDAVFCVMRVSCIPVLVAARSRECTAESYLETGLRYRVVNDLGLRKVGERPMHVSSTYQDFGFFCLLTYVTDKNLNQGVNGRCTVCPNSLSLTYRLYTHDVRMPGRKVIDQANVKSSLTPKRRIFRRRRLLDSRRELHG